jgi:hypothetical protein
MFLKQIETGDRVEVVDLTDVINPYSTTLRARVHVGDAIQRPEVFLKSELTFPSGESLPLCWTDGHYREYAAA